MSFGLWVVFRKIETKSRRRVRTPTLTLLGGYHMIKLPSNDRVGKGFGWKIVE